ncbi:pimeloyl-ACP methyl ester carboxylesterase [Rhodopseudomonas julia]|uniref:Pimeloyl-ACP methyl ester carboxylesterase n=1 Tax=Rhodopseudomonas julia TaxID=200617 RepID=A0ABU0C544_9BRAD|nr:alpha/beta hydrolase [Rhodopseudomonas julia]MDQ0325352.1 pimeloyl-ACP methyl ester carboxylesterase [Rhodopseudomonas julia]
MTETELQSLAVGEGKEKRRIAVLRRNGRSPGVVSPGVFWLGGFKSDMRGSKAEALDAWAAQSGRAATRFDYSGHGQSEGVFRDGTISRWLEEALAVFEAFTEGPQIVVGSSMGGWIALLLAKALAERGETDRLQGMVLIAPAMDMTKTLMSDHFGEAEWGQMAEKGFIEQPSDYAAEPYILTRELIEDGEKHLFGDDPIEIGCPVHILQGMRDTDVPWRHAEALLDRLCYDDAILTLVRDGDHRLSRPQDLARLVAAVETMAAEAVPGRGL